MRLGLGSGSTAAHFVRLLGERVAAGLTVVGVPTSEKTTARLRRAAGVPLDDARRDAGARPRRRRRRRDRPGLALIKGGGGALLREKIVANASERMIVIADAGKRVPELGAFPLPIEVVAFGLDATALAIERAAIELGLNAALDAQAQRRRAVRDRRRQPHARRIFWPYSRPRSPGGPARRDPRRRGARALPWPRRPCPRCFAATASRSSRHDLIRFAMKRRRGRPTEVDMKRIRCRSLSGVGGSFSAGAGALAQDAAQSDQKPLLNDLRRPSCPPETHGARDEACPAERRRPASSTRCFRPSPTRRRTRSSAPIRRCSSASSPSSTRSPCSW